MDSTDFTKPRRIRLKPVSYWENEKVPYMFDGSIVVNDTSYIHPGKISSSNSLATSSITSRVNNMCDLDKKSHERLKKKKTRSSIAISREDGEIIDKVKHAKQGAKRNFYKKSSNKENKTCNLREESKHLKNSKRSLKLETEPTSLKMKANHTKSNNRYTTRLSRTINNEQPTEKVMTVERQNMTLQDSKQRKTSNAERSVKVTRLKTQRKKSGVEAVTDNVWKPEKPYQRKQGKQQLPVPNSSINLEPMFSLEEMIGMTNEEGDQFFLERVPEEKFFKGFQGGFIFLLSRTLHWGETLPNHQINIIEGEGKMTLSDHEHTEQMEIYPGFSCLIQQGELLFETKENGKPLQIFSVIPV